MTQPECPTCGAGRNEEIDDLYRQLDVMAAELRRKTLGLAAIRDRYVKRLPGADKPKCTLCGAEEGAPHGREFNCGQAERALEVAPGSLDRQRPEGE